MVLGILFGLAALIVLPLLWKFLLPETVRAWSARNGFCKSVDSRKSRCSFETSAWFTAKMSVTLR
ncbi:MAG: hypothetical protein ACLR5S_07705 [Ruminococcus sp.]